ncbi:6-bladed beta-propeller [Gracilimonas sp.]|uniref:6-bladed beta-propeller n=1 Tax=Gracilimonas sp. TaxID=1974203 RepID=UPI002872A8B9|nr:6-bladed beta-propeller [Gracilimonas sp.]
MLKFITYSILLLVLTFCGCGNEKQSPIDNEKHHYSVEKKIEFTGFVSPTKGNDQPSEEPFSRVLSVAASDSTGNVYLLDADYKEIFVFDSLGNFLHKIRGGYGRGPGEFEFPREIAVDDHEKVYAYDYNLRRITVFKPTGEVLTTMPANISSKSIFVSGNEIWFSLLASRKNKVASKGPIEGSLKYDIPVTERDLAFNASGSVAKLGIDSKNQLIVASLIPGIWYKKVQDEFIMFGEDLLPEKEAVLSKDNIPVGPGATMGVGGLFEDKIGIVWREMNLVNGLPELGLFRLEIFEETGKHIETIELPMKWANDVFFDQNNNIYFAVDDPVPSVEKYTVTKSKN